MTLCGELMNNLDGITSELVALQLLSLCLPLSMLEHTVSLIWAIVLGSWRRINGLGVWIIHFIGMKLLPHLWFIDAHTGNKCFS